MSETSTLSPDAARPAKAVVANEKIKTLARELTEGLETIFGPKSPYYDPAIAPEPLTESLTDLLLSLPRTGSESENRLLVLTSFATRLFVKHALAPTTWTLVLDRIRIHPELANHPLGTISPLLSSALPNLPYFRALIENLDAQAEPPLGRALILHEILSADPASDLAIELSLSLTLFPTARKANSLFSNPN